MIRRGIGVQSFAAVAGGYTPSDADALAFVNAAEITNDTQKQAINTLVTDLKGYDIWTKMKAIYPFVGGTSSTHKWNLKDPRDLDAAFRLVFGGGWTHSSTGALPNGTNAYANTFFNPTSNLTNSSGHMSAYNRTNTSAGAKYEMGCYDGANANAIVSRYTGDIFYAIYGSYAATTTNNNSTGFYITNRNSTTNTTGFKNGSKVINTVTTGKTINRNLFIAANNHVLFPTGTEFSDREVAFASIGDGLTDTEAANLYTAVQAYQTSLSRNV